MPLKVRLYSSQNCPYCVSAKELLTKKGLSFEEIDLTGKDEERRSLVEKTGMRTVPQIFINEKLVGGFSELSYMDQNGELDKLLQSS